MKLIDMTVTDFASEVDSNSPAPGGGSVSALASDIGVGTLMLATGMEGAILNVKVNLMGLENKEIHDKYSKGCKEILCEGQKIKDDIIAKIHKQLD